MKIYINSLLNGAENAKGTVIIIDVFRAFTTAAFAFVGGAEKIILVDGAQKALDLKSKGYGDICFGEVNGIKPEGFDYGNSPYEISNSNIEGKILIQSTMAGTAGVVAAKNADDIYLGSLVIAEATVENIKKIKPQVVDIIAMGSGGEFRTDEDEQCALYLRNLFEGRTPDIEAVKNLILTGNESDKFDDPTMTHFHPEDRVLALQVNSIPFAIKVKKEDGLLIASPV
ncbi:MAG: 2-phosphosulfolactate phosphatase [Chloroflexi bacterium]|nr:2-phosphosulfolactate phosphatase [Chloroflexota bacterium]|tara:strand:+ start:1352 stop:2035 length:684 start_codon:yes stop_codon:yes gene_type:complete